MPVVYGITISCDNPDCPGHDLDAGSRDGWIFVTARVEANDVSQQTELAYGSTECASTAGAALSTL